LLRLNAGGKAKATKDETKKILGERDGDKVQVVVTEDPPTLTSCSSSDSDGTLPTAAASSHTDQDWL